MNVVEMVSKEKKVKPVSTVKMVLKVTPEKSATVNTVAQELGVNAVKPVNQVLQVDPVLVSLVDQVTSETEVNADLRDHAVNQENRLLMIFAGFQVIEVSKGQKVFKVKLGLMETQEKLVKTVQMVNLATEDLAANAVNADQGAIPLTRACPVKTVPLVHQVATVSTVAPVSTGGWVFEGKPANMVNLVHKVT